MKVFYLGGEKAGIIGLLSVLACKEQVTGVVAYDDTLEKIADMLGFATYKSIKEPDVKDTIKVSDMIICVHGREIVPSNILALPRYGGINVHPCLYGYKGADPVGRLLKDNNHRASIGIHTMTDELDEGTLQAEEFVDVRGCRSVEEVYNKLYPYYTIALLKVLRY